MKQLLLISWILLFHTINVCSQNIAGSWYATLNLNHEEIHYLLHFQKDKETYIGTIHQLSGSPSNHALDTIIVSHTGCIKFTQTDWHMTFYGQLEAITEELRGVLQIGKHLSSVVFSRTPQVISMLSPPAGIQYELKRIHCKSSPIRSKNWQKAWQAKLNYDYQVALELYEENMRNFPEDCMIDYDYRWAYYCAMQLKDIERMHKFAEIIYDRFYGLQIVNGDKIKSPTREMAGSVKNDLLRNKAHFSSSEFDPLLAKIEKLAAKAYQNWLIETRYLIKMAPFKEPDHLFLLENGKYKEGVIELLKLNEIQLKN